MDIGLLESINEPAADGLVPDLTIILSFFTGDGIDRIKRSGRPIDRMNGARNIHMRVGAGYLTRSA